jgi:hypothetical protein
MLDGDIYNPCDFGYTREQIYEYQSQIIDSRRDPWLPTPNPLPHRQLLMLHSIPHHPFNPLLFFQSPI